MPNSSTGVGKMLSETSGIGKDARGYYIDFTEITDIKKAINKMKEDSKTIPASEFFGYTVTIYSK